MKKDLIIGCVTHYGVNQIRNWVESIEKSGFEGDKMMVVYQVDNSVINYLLEKKFRIFRANLNYHIVVQRFIDIHSIIKRLDYRYVISTDVKDVIFQYNPIKWLEDHLGDEKKVVVSSECLKYKDENWGKNNMIHSYPQYQETMMEKEIYNAGSIAGEWSAFTEFTKKVYDLSVTGKTVQPDQAALNILTHILSPEIVRRTSQQEAWCAQLGTTMDTRVLNESKHLLLEPQPIWDSKEMKMKTSEGKDFALVHQYDRIPNLSAQINNMYK